MSCSNTHTNICTQSKCTCGCPGCIVVSSPTPSQCLCPCTRCNGYKRRARRKEGDTTLVKPRRAALPGQSHFVLSSLAGGSPSRSSLGGGSPSRRDPNSAPTESPGLPVRQLIFQEGISSNRGARYLQTTRAHRSHAHHAVRSGTVSHAASATAIGPQCNSALHEAPGSVSPLADSSASPTLCK